MRVAPARDWNVFQQIFAEHWDGFKHAHPRYQTSYYEGLVAKMLRCGDPDQMGYVEYRCLQCGEGTHRVAMSCKSSLCLRCAKVYVDNWVSQVSKVLHPGVIYRHIILTVPAMYRTTFYQNAAVILSAFMRCGAQGHSVFQCNPNESQCLCRLSRQLAACCGNVGMACPSQHPDGRIAQRGHDLWDIATAHLGAVFIKRHIAHPMGLVFNVPMSAHERQQLPGC